MLLMTVFTLSFFISCDDDGYSLGDFQISPGTVKVSTPGTYYLLLDNGKKLWPAAQDFPYFPKEDQRVWANYTLLSDNQGGFDHYVKVNALSKILTKDAINITNAQEDSIGNDKARITDIWFVDKYITIVFECNSHPGGIHFLNLVHNTDTAYPEDGKVYLEFRQNRFNVPETTHMNGSVSFNVNKYLTDDKEEITFVVLSNDFDGTKKYEIKVRKEGSAPEISIDRLSTFTEKLK